MRPAFFEGKMIKFATLFSGSSGNCTAMWNEGGLILIDFGVSTRRIVNALYGLGLAASDVSAVLITHEHSDHISGIRVFLSHYHVPVYCTKQTADYLWNNGSFSPDQEVRLFSSDDIFDIGPFKVSAFRTSHDSKTCHGFRVESGDARVALATDIGNMDDTVYSYLSGCEIVALESNYDEYMLRHGPYPLELQARISSGSGHLSNKKCSSAVARLVRDGTKHVMLMHLSKDNNKPEIAVMACRSAMENAGLSDGDCEIAAAPRSESSDVWEAGTC